MKKKKKKLTRIRDETISSRYTGDETRMYGRGMRRVDSKTDMPIIIL